jgi:hypothetical protein
MVAALLPVFDFLAAFASAISACNVKVQARGRGGGGGYFNGSCGFDVGVSRVGVGGGGGCHV